MLALVADVSIRLWRCEVREWGQRYWALVRWSIWYWRQTRRAAGSLGIVATDPRKPGRNGAHPDAPQALAGAAGQR
jgi:hypothetical protein